MSAWVGFNARNSRQICAATILIVNYEWNEFLALHHECQFIEMLDVCRLFGEGDAFPNPLVYHQPASTSSDGGSYSNPGATFRID